MLLILTGFCPDRVQNRGGVTGIIEQVDRRKGLPPRGGEKWPEKAGGGINDGRQEFLFSAARHDYGCTSSPSFCPPMVLTVVQNDAAADSLLSLSIAAASVNPIPLPPDSALASLPDALPSPPPVQTSTSTGSSHKTHRRLASTGKRGRRLSDAREAASRPS